MKSVAFNLAFKVHRNEMPFAEGLLKAVEAEVQEDFVVALNSLAGESKYNVNQLERLIEEALNNNIGQESQENKVDIEAVENEIAELKEKRKEFRESINTYESQIASLKTTINPGVNSFLAALVGFILSLLFFLMEIAAVGWLLILGTVCFSGVLLYLDVEKLKRERQEIEKKKKRFQKEIDKINNLITDINKQISEKEELITSANDENTWDEKSSDQSSFTFE